MAKQLLAPVTAAGDSDQFSNLERGESTIIMFSASGLTAGEYGDVQISHDRGATWSDLYKDGTQVRLSSVNNAVTVYGPGVFRVQKEATTNTVGIWLSNNSDT